MRRYPFPLAATSAICLACLLQACTTAPPALATTPLLRISDGDGDNPSHAYRLGRAHEGQGDLARASAAYARSLALDPAQLDARNAQAVLLAKQGRLSEAAELLRRVAVDFPTVAQPLSNLGYVFHLQGEDALAATALRSALALEPGHAVARANLALVAAATPVAVTSLGPAIPAIPAVPAAALSLTTAPQLQLVQVGPNEFRLQAPAAVAVLQAGPARASTAPEHRVTTTIASPVSVPECLHIVNANGIPGAAARMRNLLRHRGFTTASSVLGNQPGQQQARTVIEYVPGQAQRARALRAALDGPATLTAVAALPRQVTLRLVLGQDQRSIPTNLLARHERSAPAFNQESP